MRTPSDMPPPRPRAGQRRGLSKRARIIAGVVVGLLLVLVLSLRGIARFYTDYLWFDSLGYTSVWRQVLLSQVVLALVFMAAMFALLWVNLYIADRLAPTFRPPGPEEDLVRRYHLAIGGRTGLVRLGVAALFAVMVGANAASQWEEWLLFTNRVDFGVSDPQFGTDVGFYVFQLPFITYVISWLFTAFIVVLILTAAAHYLNGGIRANSPSHRVTPQVKGHLSVLLAVLAIIKAADYWFARYMLTFSARGTVDGAGYTDVNATLPAIQLLILISIGAAVMLVINIWRRGWVLPVVAVGLWGFTAVIVGGIYPAIFQRFYVEPSESSREAQFIARNIEATRQAFGLVPGEHVTIEQFEFTNDLTPEGLTDYQDTIDNLRLVDPVIAERTFEELQAIRTMYDFVDLDVDRYMIDGRLQQVVVGARELNLNSLPQTSWEGQHVSFTHGYGLALAPASRVNPGGRPDFVVGGLPVSVDTNRIDLPIDQPRIYIGENLGGYAIVNTDRPEVDFPDESGRNTIYEYSGADGVSLGGFVRRVAFALRFADVNLVVSGFLNSDSRIIYQRDVRSRVGELAPFLRIDSDPYPVVTDGRIHFVVDTYTTTARYPYSQRADVADLPGRSGLDTGGFNYIRNSVKAVVDAYDGDVTFYVMDDDDPIITAYRKIFPELFADASQMPDGLRAHLRTPEDLFRVQTNMWARYHIGDAQEFYEPAARWAVAQRPPETVQEGAAPPGRENRIPPYYKLMQLPGSDELEYVLMRPFVPNSPDDTRRQLTAFMVARNDGDNYGQLVVYEMPGTLVDGPAIASANMQNDQAVASRITLLSQRGSTVRLGNMLLMPIGGSIVYVRPLYVEGDNTLPELANVIVAYDNDVRMCPGVELALNALFIDQDDLDDRCTAAGRGATVPAGDTTPAPDPEPDPDETELDPTPTPTPPPAPAPTPVPDGGEQPSLSVADLLARADEAFAEADAALAEGDLGGFADKIAEARALIAEATALAREAEGPTPAPTPTPTPTPTPEPDTA